MEPQVCGLEDCNTPLYARRRCAWHYQVGRIAGTLPETEAVDRRCEHCSELMTARLSNRAKFCSPRCKDLARTAAKRQQRQASLADRTCKLCGGPVAVTAPVYTETCSPACGVTYQNRKRAEAKRAQVLANRKPCQKCGGPIPRDKNSKALFCSWKCKHNEMSNRTREKNPGYMRQYTYGITPEEYDDLLSSQGGVCAICRTAEWPGKGPHLDHDHETGVIRGILCHKCNLGLGKFNDNPDLMLAAIAYLKAAKA